jgi:hypothetical protein
MISKVEKTIQILQQENKSLVTENEKLKAALADLICWAGNSPDGLSWATAEAKENNRRMFETAFRRACECFPENHGQSTNQPNAN